ncbi:MAG TPA: hypothetical protein ENL06_02750 [Candidatus Portnoybacteria bacterium]|nr:hypothetical protein [Candidatus Portnoybacteria bacterium]
MKEKIEQFKNSEEPRYASVKDTIYTNEQRYVDSNRRYAHNDLYFATVIEVVKIEADRVLVRDDTGDFWVPRSKLNL